MQERRICTEYNTASITEALKRVYDDVSGELILSRHGFNYGSLETRIYYVIGISW